MTQSTYAYAESNESGAAYRAGINTGLTAIVSLNPGTVAPSPTFSQMWWADTSNNLLKQRNVGNTAWVVRGSLDSTFTLSKSSAYPCVASDICKTIWVDATSGPVTITLIAVATGGDGWNVTVQKVDSTANAVTVTGDANINGAATFTIVTQYNQALFTTNGTIWGANRLPIETTGVGAISVTSGAVSVATGSSSVLGVVKVDGSTISANAGVISVVSGQGVTQAAVYAAIYSI